jgi:outer membrane receptor protein involved in Fe transport
MHSRFLAILSAAVASLLALSTFVAAQAATASISGIVVDETGAVVRDAVITVVNVATGVERTATAAAQGTFAVPLLVPGIYRVTAQHDGFTPSLLPAVALNVGDVVAVKMLLKIARIGETVTVTAEPPRVSMSAAVGTVIDRQFAANLPLNGRSFQSLISMTPGVVLTPASSNSPGQFSVNGQRSDANYFMVDGVSANVGVQPTAGLGPSGAGAVPGLSAQGGTNSLVSVDALQEFRIETSTYAAEFGRAPGAQISIVTRSGTNQPHGSVFEYFRHDALDSPDYFVERQHLPKPRERQHDFGGTFGGPIQRNRTFAFISYERLRLEQPRSVITEVPSLPSRLAAQDSVKPLLAAFPLPNGPETARGLAQFSASYADPATLDATSVRIDRALGTFSMFGRYNYAASAGASRLGSFGAASANTIGWVKNRLQTLTTGLTWIATPNVSQELRVNWSRNRGTNFQTIDAFGGAMVPPAVMLHPAFVPAASTYRVNLSTPNVFFDEGPNSSNIQRQLNIVNAVLLAKGRHQLKLGIDYRRLLPVYRPTAYVQAYTFNGVAGVLSGTASVLTAASSTSNRNSRASNFSAFAQDTWTPSSRWTLTYGLRWEVNPAPQLSDSDESLTLATADPASIALAPAGTPMYRTTFDNLGPRIGAAYRLTDSPGREMVLRGGWGVFFDLSSPAVMNNLSQTFPFTAQRSFSSVSFPADPGILTPPTIAPGAPADFLVAADPRLKLPYTYQWNMTVEQAMGAHSSVSLSYVGAIGRRLLSQERILNPTPQFQVVTVGTNHGHSVYKALQVKFTRRLTSGLQSLLSYTLAQSKDNVSNDTVPVLPFFRADPNEDWGPSAFDVRHTFSGGITYALPAPPASSLWQPLGRGWAIDAVFVARSALPVNVVTGATAFAVTNALRPDRVAGVPLYVDDASVPGGRRINAAAFALPPSDANGDPLRQGTLGRNALRGFGMNQVDLAVRRQIELDRWNLQLRLEAFNVFNHASFAQPTNALSSGVFGQPTRTLASGLGGGGVAGGGFSPLYQVGGARSIQLAARLQF